MGTMMHGSSSSTAAPAASLVVDSGGGGGASTSTSALSSFANSPVTPPFLQQQHHHHHHQQQSQQSQQSRKHRYSSRSDSISGSSVSTVKRAASRSSSRNGAPTSALPMRSQSPGDTSRAALRNTGGTIIKAVHHPHYTSDNPDDLESWSHLTDSSVASNGRAKRRRASGGDGSPLTLNTATPPLSPQRQQTRHTLNQSPKRSPQYSSAAQSRPRQRPHSPLGRLDNGRAQPRSRPSSRGNPFTALPPLHTTAFHDDTDSDSPSTGRSGSPTTNEALTPSTYSSTAQDSLASENTSPRNSGKNRRPANIRMSTAPGTSLNYSRMPTAEALQQSAHNRRRSEHLLNMGGVVNSARAVKIVSEDRQDKHPRQKERAEREKKAMLSKALEKANTAVVLDNNQNFEGALDAYRGACALLQQVMDRSASMDDRRKLEAIRVTYNTRIEELRLIEDSRPSIDVEKNLPSRPMSNDSQPISPIGTAMSPIDGDMREPVIFKKATAAPVIALPRLSYPKKDHDSFFDRTMADVDRAGRLQHDPSPVQDDRSSTVSQRTSRPPPSHEETNFIPAPLLPRKVPSPTHAASTEEAWQRSEPFRQAPTSSDASGAQSEGDAAASWLDTIDETASSSSSVHSVFSQKELRRKHLGSHSDDDDEDVADLDAAFDAAVEAAYDEGLEPDLGSGRPPKVTHSRNESTGILSADVKEMLSPTAPNFTLPPAWSQRFEEAEEERLLDEITQDYAHGFNFDLGVKSALPRQSDSSGYSRSTWQSSQASERATAGTSLSTVAEIEHTPQSMAPTKHVQSLKSPPALDNLPPSAPPPSIALPAPPKPSPMPASTVRSRRLSGQMQGELKIETSADAQNRKRASTLHNPRKVLPDNQYNSDSDTHKEVLIGAPLELSPSEVQHAHILNSPPSLDLLSSRVNHPTIISSHFVAERPRTSDETTGDSLAVRPTIVRKNQSTLSLRTDHTILLPSPHGMSEIADPTPFSATFTTSKSKYNQDPLISQRVAFPPLASQATMQMSGGTYLFDTSLSSSKPTASPVLSPSQQPVGLEPCPESFLLRPFWLMRSIASTIIHERGGFLTNRLFVPREVWQTRGVKLKYLDDKIANCDLLTAALGHLAEVDTLDADAVMDELQRFEEVMERVQAALIKRLGSEVGVHGVGGLFKDAAPPMPAGAGDRGSEYTTSTDKGARSYSGKSYLSSWRKLRSKSSGGAITHSTPLSSGMRNGFADKDTASMPSVPMTSFVPVERRGQKRDVRNMSFDGPNKEYMGSIARLFHGVQVLDQIARQVEDPGLKHSSETHVGLELSIRHAAEFFSFYICRFVLADLGTLIDKFVKRGTEWVMA